MAASYLIAKVASSSIVALYDFLVGIGLKNVTMTDVVKGVTGFSLLAIIAYSKEILTLRTSVSKYILEAADFDFATNTIKLVLSAIPVLMPFFLDVQQPAKVPLAIVKMDSVLVLPATPLETIRFAVSWGVDADCRGLVKPYCRTLGAENDGVTLSDANKKFLVRFAQALSRCSGIRDGVERKARVKVVGFASSSGPEGDLGELRRRNINAANSRAENVMKVLRENASDQVILFQEAWSIDQYEVMRGELLFNDQVDAQYLSNIAELTRRAEVRLLDAGSCKLEPATKS